MCKTLEQLDKNITFRFLDLLPEICDQIYEDLLLHTDPCRPDSCFPPRNAQILFACKQSFAEAGGIQYGSAQLQLKSLHPRSRSSLLHGSLMKLNPVSIHGTYNPWNSTGSTELADSVSSPHEHGTYVTAGLWPSGIVDARHVHVTLSLENRSVFNLQGMSNSLYCLVHSLNSSTAGQPLDLQIKLTSVKMALSCRNKF